VPFQTTAESSLGTDNLLLKTGDGSLLAIRMVGTWGPVAQRPPWWDRVNIQGKPHGARVAAYAWRSTDCGATWTRVGSIDPINIANGRYAVPRPTEEGCPQGCFGGWDRIDGYVDPWTGHIYVTANAVGGPVIDYTTGREIEGHAVTHFLFRSTDGGASWNAVHEFGAWTPIVVSSTPNGRVFLYSVIGDQPSLAYSQAGGGQLRFSRF
jgi:hypothetical protein